MSLKQRIAHGIASWAIKNLNDRMTAEQLVTAAFGPTSTGLRYGSTELLRAYSTMPWLRSVVGRISWSTAVVPWQLYAVTGKAEDGKRYMRRKDIAESRDPKYRLEQYKSLRRSDRLEEIETHAALDFLETGNDRFSGHVARQVTQQHLDLVGEGAWVIERDGLGMPTKYWPIPPTWIAQTPWSPLNTGLGVINGQSTIGNWIIHSNRGTLVVPPDDVVYFYHPNPADPYDRGRGIGHSLGDELETDEAAAKHLKRWFKNFAIPPVIISRKQSGPQTPGAGGPNMARLEEKWMAKLLGRNNVPFFSTHELSVHEMNHTFQEMQLSQLRKDERDILIHVYGLPPEVFGILEQSNRSTIDAADYLMGKYVIVPRLEFQRAIIQKQLIEKYDERLILDYVSPVLEDREFELKVMQAMPHDFTVDEIRELANRRPLPNGAGEGFFVPMSSMYVRDLTEAAYEEPVLPEEPAEDEGAEEGSTEEE